MQPSCALIVVLYRPVEIRWWGQWDTKLENGFQNKGAHSGKARFKKKNIIRLLLLLFSWGWTTYQCSPCHDENLFYVLPAWPVHQIPKPDWTDGMLGLHRIRFKSMRTNATVNYATTIQERHPGSKSITPVLPDVKQATPWPTFSTCPGGLFHILFEASTQGLAVTF